MITLVPASAKTAALSNSQIRSAIRTVYVWPEGKTWRIKKVAAPTIQRTGSKTAAIAKAQALASPEKWDVVVLNSKGRVARILERGGSKMLKAAV